MPRLSSSIVIFGLVLLIVVEFFTSKIIQLNIVVETQRKEIEELENSALEMFYETEFFNGKKKDFYLLHFGYSRLDTKICHLAKTNNFTLETGINCDNLVQSSLIHHSNSTINSAQQRFIINHSD